MTTTTIEPATQPLVNLPSTSNVFSRLLKSDLKVQWRNRRATIIVILIPSIILFSWKGLVKQFGGAFALSNCITFGLNAIGLMGYANSIARDRDKGIFQRLRLTPVPRWTIIASRLAVQLVMIIVMSLVLFIIGYQVDKITLTPTGYVLGLLTAIIGGAAYLSLGQMIVGLIRNVETVNVTSRLVFFLFIMIGQIASFGGLGEYWGNIANWSPYGATKTIIAAALTPGAWNNNTSISLLMSLGYTLVFTILGIRYFRWSTK